MKVSYKSGYLYYKKEGKHFRVSASDRNLKALIKLGYDCKSVLTLGHRLTKPLYPYQFTSPLQAKEHGWNLLIADEMGVGKSLQAVACMVASKAEKTIYIVPANIKYQWKRVIESSCHVQYRIYICEGQTFEYADAMHVKHADIVIISYNLLDYWVDLFCKFKWDMMILDEAHKLKHTKSNCTKAAKLLRPHVNSCIGLSGTPLTDRTADIWNVVHLIDKTLFPSHFAFQQRYCCNFVDQYNRNSQSANTLELHDKLVNSGVMLRRTKKDVYAQQPKVNVEVVPFNVRSEVLTHLADEATKQSKWMLKQHGKDRGVSAFKVQQSLEQYLQEAIKLKLPLIVEWLNDLLEETDKTLVVACVHREKCGSILYEHFKDVAVLVDGSSSAKQKDVLVEQFKRNDDVRMLIGNIQSIGTGLDGLQDVCSKMVICELPWSPADLSQLIARLDRNGQKETVEVSFMVVYDSIDEMLVRMLDRKKKITTEVLDGIAPRREETLAHLLGEAQ